MKYFVKIRKEDSNYLNKKELNNLNVKDESINFETNEKSLQLLINDIKEIEYFNKRKLKLILFIKKYLISIISIFILFLFIINEQLTIKKINFVNENTYNQEVEDYIYQSLEKRLIFYYLNKNINELNKELKNEFYFYEWINVDKKGNNLNVYIDKQDEFSYLDESSKVLGNIVSNYDCIIRYFFIKKGVNLVKDNQVIKKGDVLVSGNLKYYNEGEIKYIHPIGIILGEVVSYEIIKIKKVETKYKRTGRIQIFDKVSLFNMKTKSNCKFDIYEEEINIIKKNKLYEKKQIIFYEIAENNIIYEYDDALEYGYSLIEKQFNQNKIHNKEMILDKYLLDSYEDDDYFYFKYMIKKVVNISKFEAVKLED